MKDEKMAEQFADNYDIMNKDLSPKSPRHIVKECFLAGLKAGRPQWHKVTDWEDNSQFPKDELQTYVVRLYQDHYVICELDITEGYRQFYLPDNLEYIDPQDVIAWCEIPI